MLTPEQFVAHWADTRLKETASCVTHFDDLYELLGHPKPAHMDKTGEKFAYQKEVIKNAQTSNPKGALRGVSGTSEVSRDREEKPGPRKARAGHTKGMKQRSKRP